MRRDIMPSELEHLYELHDEIDKKRQRWARVLPVGDFRGVAAGGTVEVVATAEGEVMKIVVHDGWRKVVPAEGLRDAVLEAYNDSRTVVMQEWAEALDDDEEEPDPAPRPVPALEGSFTAMLDQHMTQMDPEAAEQTLNRLAALVQQAVDGRDEAEQLISERLTAEHEGSDPSGAVCVTLQATGVLVDVDIDLDWLEGRPATDITARLGEALAAARHTMAAAVPANIMAGTPLALLADPDALMKEISR
jgi:DNA-binding protein YbaB